jgi:glycosyltransferase involved in cell wall biosynthesis
MQQTSVPKLVTIGLPMWKRLEFLPHVLKVIEAQDYPSIELLVSDNGQNGDKIREMVSACYSRPYKFRQNPSPVSPATHFNQIIHEASGTYFVLLMDDDEISSNYVSELVHQFERFPGTAIAFAAQESIDETGVVIQPFKESLPETLPGPDFILSMWGRYELGFDIVATFLAKTEDIRACGGYPDFTRGSHIENALVTKLCLRGNVAFSSKCLFRWRVVRSSYGWSVPIGEFASATRGLLRFLRDDPVVREFAAKHPAKGKEIKSCMARMAWETYLWRWRDIYNRKLSCARWLRAAFAMPFITDYYKQVARVLVRAAIRRNRAPEEGFAAHGI